MEFRQVLAVKFVHRVTLVGVDRFRGFIQDLRDANRAEPVTEQHANPKLLIFTCQDPIDCKQIGKLRYRAFLVILIFQ